MKKKLIYFEPNDPCCEGEHKSQETLLKEKAIVGWAYFADENADMSKIRGDDWDDAPKCCNAGAPYRETVKGYEMREIRLGDDFMPTQTQIKEEEKEFKPLIHDWFELSYASYLVLPRSILQSTPKKWQIKFVELLEELENMGFTCPEEGNTYVANTRNNKTGRFTTDIYQSYERGRREITPNPKL